MKVNFKSGTKKSLFFNPFLSLVLPGRTTFFARKTWHLGKMSQFDRHNELLLQIRKFGSNFEPVRNPLGICWESTRNPLGICWESARKPPGICWESTRHLLVIHGIHQESAKKPRWRRDALRSDETRRDKPGRCRSLVPSHPGIEHLVRGSLT